MTDDETQDLRTEQQQRAAREECLADESEQPREEDAHRRRADKARYLEAKLLERARAESGDDAGRGS